MEILSIFRKENKGLSLRANFSWTFFGNVVYAVTQWGLTIFMTKFYTPDVFGRFALALSIVTPIFAASALQLRAVMVSDSTGKIPFLSYFSLRVLTSALALILVLAIGLLGDLPDQTINLMLFLGLGQAVIMVKDIFQGIMQRAERMDFASISRMLQGIVSLLCAGIFTIVTKNVVFVTVGMFFGRFIVLIFFDVPFSKGFSGAQLVIPKNGNWMNFVLGQDIWNLARIALPMGIVTLLISLHTNIPRYFLAGSFGEAAVGFYSAVATYLALEDIVISALGQSAAHRLSILYVESKRGFFRLLGKLSWVGIVIGVFGVAISLFLGRELLTIFFTKEYAIYADVLCWLMIARVVLNAYSFLGYGMTAARKFTVQIWISGFMTGSLFLASWLLIPSFAGLGAAWAVLISAVVGLVASMLVMRKDFVLVYRAIR